jgi:hypothetical protein
MWLLAEVDIRGSYPSRINVIILFTIQLSIECEMYVFYGGSKLTETWNWPYNLFICHTYKPWFCDTEVWNIDRTPMTHMHGKY